MLVYNPAFDIHHGIFRMLQLLVRLYPNRVEVDKLLILDFYLLFPNKLPEAKLTSDVRLLTNKIVNYKENPYSKVSNAKILFNQMRNYQLASLSCLASYSLIDKELLEAGWVELEIASLSQDVKSTIADHYLKESALIDLLTKHLAKIDLKNNSGLKSRTGLMEYRYDIR